MGESGEPEQGTARGVIWERAGLWDTFSRLRFDESVMDFDYSSYLVVLKL